MKMTLEHEGKTHVFDFRLIDGSAHEICWHCDDWCYELTPIDINGCVRDFCARCVVEMLAEDELP